MSTNAHSPLIRVQNFWQYLLFGWFLAVSVLQILGGNLAGCLALAGVGLILVAIVTVLITLGEQFRSQAKRTWFLLCYVLIGILAITATVKYLVH